MAGLMHRVDPILADTRPDGEYHAIRRRFRAFRLRPDIPAAVAEWEAARVELGLGHWTESALNGRDGDRDRLADLAEFLPTPERARPYVPTEQNRARIRAAVAASYPTSKPHDHTLPTPRLCPTRRKLDRYGRDGERI